MCKGWRDFSVSRTLVSAEFQVFRLDPDLDAPIERAARREMRENGDKMLRSLEKKVRDRLWNAGLAPI